MFPLLHAILHWMHYGALLPRTPFCLEPKALLMLMLMLIAAALQGVTHPTSSAFDRDRSA